MNETSSVGLKSHSTDQQATSNEQVDSFNDVNNNTPLPQQSQTKIELPAFFKQTKNAWVKKEVKSQGVKKASPGYKNAVKRIEDNYEAEYDTQLKDLTLEQYKALPDNKDVPNEVLDSAYEQLIKDEIDTTKPQVMFSLTENNAAFNQAVDRVFAGERVNITRGSINLGTTPKVLKDLGIPDLPVVINTEKLVNIKADHNLTAELLKQIPTEINSPVMVFKNNKPKAPKNSFVILTELTDKNGKSVITALHTERKQGKIQVNRIASIYGKDGDKEYIANNIKYGNVVYSNKEKARKVMARLQLPPRLLNGLYDVIIPQHNQKTTQIQDWIKDLPFAKNIKVANTPKDLGVPNNVRGVWKGGDIHLIASNINNQQEAIQVALHEAVGHDGLRKILGKNLNKVLDSVYGDMAQDVKTVATRLNLDIKDTRQRRQATEELIAETAETLLDKPNKTPPKFMAKVMSAIRKALRNMNVWDKDVWDKKAILELLVRVKQRVESENNHIQNKDIPYVAIDEIDTTKPQVMFSLTENNTAFNQAVDRVFAGERVNITRGSINLGTTPKVLKDLGMPDLPVVIKPDKIQTIKEKHNLTAELLKQIPKEINNPTAIFNSSTKNKAFVVLTKLKDTRHKPVITALHIERKQGKIQVNRVASVYGKDNFNKFINDNVNSGNLVYKDDRFADFLGSHLVRLQETATNTNNSMAGVRNSIPQHNQKTTQIQNWINDLPFAKNIKVANTPKDLSVPNNVRGVWKDGDIHLIASNINNQQEAIQVALHEAVGHDGLRKILGKNLNKVLDRDLCIIHNS